MKQFSSDKLITTKIPIPDSICHLLAFYLNYILEKHLEGILSLPLQFLGSSYTLFSTNEYDL
jgi:hypothetical protein